MNQEQINFNVWEAQRFFKTNGVFPKMTESEKITFLDFANCQVDDSIEAYERFSYNHGGLREEAKEMMKEISEAEQMLKKLRDSN